MGDALHDELLKIGAGSAGRALLDAAERKVDLDVALVYLPHGGGPTLFVHTTCYHGTLMTREECERVMLGVTRAGIALSLHQHCGCGKHMNDPFSHQTLSVRVDPPSIEWIIQEQQRQQKSQVNA